MHIKYKKNSGKSKLYSPPSQKTIRIKWISLKDKSNNSIKSTLQSNPKESPVGKNSGKKTKNKKDIDTKYNSNNYQISN